METPPETSGNQKQPTLYVGKHCAIAAALLPEGFDPSLQIIMGTAKSDSLDISNAYRALQRGEPRKCPLRRS
jgi:hypothetical protein